jgi:hypothetical protein
MQYTRRIGIVVAVLFGAMACSSSTKSSVVTGFIAPCAGTVRAPEPHAAGTVTALRGAAKTVRISADQVREVLPEEVAARTHTDGHEPFQLRLPPGDYVLAGSYDDSPTTATVAVPLRVPPSPTTLERELPSPCK